jgi:hypothetical protein
VTKPRVRNLVGTIVPAAVLRGCSIVEAVGLAITLDGIVDAAARVDDREGLTTLPHSDHVGLPSGERGLLDTGEALSELQFVVQTEREAVLDVVL